jgi:hypothetical protein
MTATLDRGRLERVEHLVQLALARTGGGGGGGGGGDGTTTSAAFSQPAVGSNVVVSVVSPAGAIVGAWALVGGGGGAYVIRAVGASTLTLTNVGTSNLVVNAAPTTVIALGSTVTYDAPTQMLVSGGLSDLTLTAAAAPYQNIPNVGQISGAGGLGGVLPLHITGMQFDATQAAPFIGQLPTANAVGQNLRMTPQASTNLASGSPGRLIGDLSDPTGAGTWPSFDLEWSGVVGFRVGPMNNSNSFCAIWNMPIGLAAAPDQTNFQLGANGSGDTWLNSGRGAFIFYDASNGNLTHATYQNPSGWQFFAASPGTDFGGGVDVLGLTNARTPPAGTPLTGPVIWGEAGAARVKGTGGTTTTFGPAEPHCPVCGCDYMTEHENPLWGYLSICLRCLALELGPRPYIVHAKRAA